MNIVQINKVGEKMPKVLTNVKEDICRVTRQILNEDGYEQLSTRGISTRCGIALGTIYNYYKTKDEIIEEIVMSDWELTNRRMDHLLNSEADSFTKLEGIFNLLRDFVYDFHGLWIDMVMTNKKPAETGSIKCRRHDYRSQLKDKIARATATFPLRMKEKDIDFMNDLLARSFLSYCQDKDASFDDFKAFLISMNSLNNTSLQD